MIKDELDKRFKELVAAVFDNTMRIVENPSIISRGCKDRSRKEIVWLLNNLRWANDTTHIWFSALEDILKMNKEKISKQIISVTKKKLFQYKEITEYNIEWTENEETKKETLINVLLNTDLIFQNINLKLRKK